MTEWQDEPTEAGWYWMAEMIQEGPLFVSRRANGTWEVDGANWTADLNGRKVMPIPEPEDA